MVSIVLWMCMSLSFSSVAESLEDDCRAMVYAEPRVDKALEGHVIATLRVKAIDTCEIKCFIENDCVSYNYGPGEDNQENICELNNSTNEEHLKVKTFFTYRGTENACGSNPCLNNAKCQSGFTQKQFRCLCTGGYEGELCEKAHTFGECKPQDPYCFGRIPIEVIEDSTELLAVDSLGNEYLWKFNSTIGTAHAAWRAFHDHIAVQFLEAHNTDEWNPEVLNGTAPIRSQDSFMYREQNGVKSVMLDDDSCECFSSLHLGHSMCIQGFDSRFGINNQFGVEELYDSYCNGPTPGIGLVLYYRSN